MTNRQKQRQLQFLGYYKGTIDGLWGEQSVAATRQFQKANGLDDDGIFGAKTEQKTIELIVAIQKNVGASVDGLAGNETIAKYNAWKEKQATSDSKTSNTSGDWWETIKHFERKEFACKCGGKYCNGFPVEPNAQLVTVADRVREHFGKAIHVSSGVRCAQHNANVGGVSNSRHKSGKAMDMRVIGYTSSQVLAYVQKQPEIRYAYAIDGCYVHMDVE